MAGVLRGVAGSARCALQQAQLSPCAGAHALPCTLHVLCLPCAEQRLVSVLLSLTHCLRGGAGSVLLLLLCLLASRQLTSALPAAHQHTKATRA